MNRQRLFRCANLHQRAITLEKRQISIDVMLGSNRIDNQVEAGSGFRHLVCIARNNHFMRAKFLGVICL
ncbi:hypothetical protein D3C86_2168280 [compost metagenome]